MRLLRREERSLFRRGRGGGLNGGRVQGFSPSCSSSSRRASSIWS
jgi:hypothetical protein